MMKKEEIKSFLITKYLEKPFSKTEDLIKLLYQSYFGARHLIENDSNTISKLKNELKSANKGEIEELLNGYVRYPLSLIQDPEHFYDVFSSQKFIKANEKEYMQSLNILKELIENAELKLDIEVLNKYMTNPFKPISHSKEYTKKYDPHYRIISKTLLSKI